MNEAEALEAVTMSFRKLINDLYAADQVLGFGIVVVTQSSGPFTAVGGLIPVVADGVQLLSLRAAEQELVGRLGGTPDGAPMFFPPTEKH